MNDLLPFTVLDWNQDPVAAASSKGGVLALADVNDNLLKPDGIPWPPAPIIQKLYKSRQQAAFEDPARAVVTKRLGYYCDLQSVNSEDAMTWNYFGAFLSAPRSERSRFGNWVLGQLDPDTEPSRTWALDLWRRIPHPESLVPGGPEIDFLLVGEHIVIFGEAKWHSPEGKGQGLDGNKTQLQLRSEFLHRYGTKIYGDERKFYVLLVTLDRVDVLAPHHPSVAVRGLTWSDLCAYSEHPMHAQVLRYYDWKRQHGL